MDANIGEGRLYTDKLYMNDSMISKMRACTLFIMDSTAVQGAYHLEPAVNKWDDGHNTINISARAQSITFVKISLNNSWPISSFSQVISLSAFRDCYDNNRWLRKKLEKKGFESVDELINGFSINNNDFYDPVIPYPTKEVHVRKRMADTMYYHDNGKDAPREKADYFTVVHPDTPGYYSVNKYDAISKKLMLSGHYSNVDS